jgi:hypothetical protein
VGEIGKSVLLLNIEIRIRFRQDEVRDSMLPRKASREIINNPYRKPTQVDEKRILRCLDEL